MTLREEFDSLIEKIGKEGENDFILAVCHKNDAYMKDMMQFIKENNLNYNHLWGDGEIARKAYKDYEKILNRTDYYY